jgi:hypothetical protein
MALALREVTAEPATEELLDIMDDTAPRNDRESATPATGPRDARDSWRADSPHVTLATRRKVVGRIQVGMPSSL